MRRLALLVALRLSGLLLCSSTLCACLETCEQGVVGQRLQLPCFYQTAFGNFSVEWKRDSEVVLRSVWQEDKHVDLWRKPSVTMAADAPRTGNFSLELLHADPTEHNTTYGLFIHAHNIIVLVCSVCVRMAASFSGPQLKRRASVVPGGEVVFSCHSSGGFPEPSVSWLIDDSLKPPEGSVETIVMTLPESHLYNITSHLTLNISMQSNVSCTIGNEALNETMTATSYGVKISPVVSRASEVMWIFSTALCVVVGVMVAVGVAYQIHLDRVSKRKKLEYQESHLHRGRRWRHLYMDETDELKSEPKETDV
ncbi:ICOS ligand-like [Synchiropus picturatus]